MMQSAVIKLYNLSVLVPLRIKNSKIVLSLQLFQSFFTLEKLKQQDTIASIPHLELFKN